MLDELAHLLAMVLVYALAMVVRRVRRTAFWQRVETRGDRYLKDPTVPADDPMRAAEMALADEQRESVQRVAQRIASPPEAPRTTTKRWWRRNGNGH